MGIKIEYLTDLPAVKAYIKRIDAEFVNVREAHVRERVGKYFREIATIEFDKRTGEVKADPHEYAPSEREAERIKNEILDAEWPVWRKARDDDPKPQAVLEASPDDVFEYRDTDGALIMYQVRSEVKGERAYRPYTIYEDGKWRCLMPDLPHIPLWGMENIGTSDVAIISEGGKAARAMQRMISQKTTKDRSAYAAHPWATELDYAVHIGFTAGAFAAKKADWRALKKNGIKQVIIVPDHDEVGYAAVKDIASLVDLPCRVLQFDDRWPVSWDLADPMPDTLFEKRDGKGFYTGPSFHDLLTPATWATELVIPPGEAPDSKKRVAILRSGFKGQWLYVNQTGLFVWKHDPRTRYDETKFNAVMRRWSDVKDTASLVLKSQRINIDKITYRPDVKSFSRDEHSRLVNEDGDAALNLYTGSKIKSEPGDLTQWHKFLAHLFPEEQSRKCVERWVATIIARPDVRMKYAMLLASVQTGTGKTTLCESVLRPLVGEKNYSSVGEDGLVNSQFNDWIAEKTLVVCNEIYQAGTWKAANRLKELITDQVIRCNEKYKTPYTLRNHAHFVACSNSPVAVRIEDADRRWLVPEVTEKIWGDANFNAFHSWLKAGGLSHIKHWAEQYGDYVKSGERAPDTKTKKRVIEESRSETCQEAFGLAKAIETEGLALSFSQTALNQWLRTVVHVRDREKDHEIRKAMVEAGMKVWPQRMSLARKTQNVMVSSLLYSQLMALPEEKRGDTIRAALRTPEELPAAIF